MECFTVVLRDRYDVVYTKTVNNVKKKGVTEVCLTKEDKDESTESVLTGLTMLFNGD